MRTIEERISASVAAFSQMDNPQVTIFFEGSKDALKRYSVCLRKDGAEEQYCVKATLGGEIIIDLNPYSEW